MEGLLLRPRTGRLTGLWPRAELDLASFAIDLDRQREAEEAAVVVDGGERFARAVGAAGLVAVEPLARVTGRRAGRAGA